MFQKMRRRRPLIVGLAAGLLLSLFAFLASTAQAGSGDNYPDAWKNAPMDTAVDSWGYYNRECTSFVAWALHDRNGYDMPHAIGSAIDWQSWAQSNGVQVNNTPAVGAVAYFSYGHVAWVSAVSNGTVALEEYNYDYTGHYHTRTIATSGVTSFLHFSDITTPPPPPPGSSRIAQVDGTNNLFARDGLGSAWVQQASNVKSVDIAFNTGRMLYVNYDNKAYSKDSLTSAAVIQFDGAVAAAISPDGNRMMVAQASGDVYAKDGSGPWTHVAGPMVKAIDVGYGNRMIFVDGSNNVYTIEGPLTSTPALQFNDARQIAASPNTARMLLSTADGRIWTKDSGAWAPATGTMVKKMAIGPDGRIAYIDGADNGFTMNNPGETPVSQKTGIAQLILGGAGITLATNSSGVVYGKDTGDWVQIGGPMIKYFAASGSRMV